MPYIRDNKTSFAATATGSFVVGLPNHEINDVLFIFVVRDGQSGSLQTPSGWTQVSISDPTQGVFVQAYYKVAASSSESNPAVGTTVNETFSGVAVAIAEADTADVVEDSNSSTGNGALTTTPALTTSNDNCLILHFCGADTLSGPALEPGKMWVNSFDGAAESVAAFWDYKFTAGAVTSQTWYRERLTNHVLFSVAINGDTSNIPPQIAPGTTPTTMIHPLMGTETDTGYGGTFTLNASSIAATVDGISVVSPTSFGSTTDAGVNPVHDGLLLRAGAASQAGDFASGYITFDAALDLTGKDIIFHVFADSQFDSNTLDSVSGRGLVVGLVDTGGDWKAWQIAAQNSRPTDKSQIPIVIAPDEDISVLDSSGTFDVSAIDRMFFLANSPSGDTRHNFSQLQELGVLEVVGGWDSNPITLDAIADLAFSAFTLTAQQQNQQAQSQILLYTAVQIGDGSSGAYFDVSSASIEFPGQSDVAERRLQYNTIAGRVGITFYGVLGDTIKLTDSAITSTLGYKFEIDPSSTDAAIWDFSGLQVIGAGPIILNDVGQLGGISFSRGSTVTLNDCDLSGGCTFSNMSSPVVSITTQAELDQLANCSFINNNVHIQVDVAGSLTLSFDNITFTGGLFDIHYTGTGTLTAQMINGSNATSAAASGGGTVNIVTARTLTLEGVANPSEVRIYDNATGLIEIAGQEDVTTGTFAADIDIGLYPSVIVRILSLEYDNKRIQDIDMSQGNVTLPIDQDSDRQFENPA